jgi:hypothetical protein
MRLVKISSAHLFTWLFCAASLLLRPSFYTCFQGLLINRELPYIDPRWRTRSYVEGRLVEIMEKCWSYDPDQRIDIFEAVRLLRETLKVNNRRKAEARRLLTPEGDGQAVVEGG